jgi:hypothetical protein
VHQLLVYIRVDNPSITSGIESYRPYLLHERILLERYGPLLLDTNELQQRRVELKRSHEDYLASEAFSGREEEFWAYQRLGLAELGEDLDAGRRRALWWRGMSDHLFNPKRSLQRMRDRRRAAAGRN